MPYGDQVILARTHLTLARITGVLEQLGVPLLYLGDLFERDEIRDLLSLVALDAEFGGIGLVRVAALAGVPVPREDALAVIRWAQSTTMRDLRRAEAHCRRSTGSAKPDRAGLAKLGSQLDGLSDVASPWTLLTTWLFERSDYLRPLLVWRTMPFAQQARRDLSPAEGVRRTARHGRLKPEDVSRSAFAASKPQRGQLIAPSPPKRPTWTPSAS